MRMAPRSAKASNFGELTKAPIRMEALTCWKILWAKFFQHALAIAVSVVTIGAGAPGYASPRFAASDLWVRTWGVAQSGAVRPNFIFRVVADWNKKAH